MTWLCEKLGLPDPGIDPAPEASRVEQEAELYFEHVLERWRTPLADVEEARFGATHKTRWGEDMSCEGMLEHAVMHPIRPPVPARGAPGGQGQSVPNRSPPQGPDVETSARRGRDVGDRHAPVAPRSGKAKPRRLPG